MNTDFNSRRLAKIMSFVGGFVDLRFGNNLIDFTFNVLKNKKGETKERAERMVFVPCIKWQKINSFSASLYRIVGIRYLHKNIYAFELQETDMQAIAQKCRLGFWINPFGDNFNYIASASGWQLGDLCSNNIGITLYLQGDNRALNTIEHSNGSIFDYFSEGLIHAQMKEYILKDIAFEKQAKIRFINEVYGSVEKYEYAKEIETLLADTRNALIAILADCKNLKNRDLRNSIVKGFIAYYYDSIKTLNLAKLNTLLFDYVSNIYVKDNANLRLLLRNLGDNLKGKYNDPMLYTWIYDSFEKKGKRALFRLKEYRRKTGAKIYYRNADFMLEK